MSFMKRLSLYLLAFVFLIRVQEVFPILIPLKLVYLTLGTVFVVLLAAPTRKFMDGFSKVPFGKWILFFLVTVIISIPMSVWVGGSVEAFQRFIYTLFVYSAICMLCTDRYYLESMTNAILISVGVISFAMITSSATGRISVGGMYDANDIALIFITFLPVFVAEWNAKTMLPRTLALIGACMCISALILTQSRGAFLSLMFTGLYFLGCQRKKLFKRMILLVLLGGVLMVLAGDEYWARMSTLTDLQSDYNMNANAGRWEVWKDGLRVFKSRFFILGVGVGQIATALGVLGAGVWKTAHNSFLQVAVELGIQGFICYMFILGGAFFLVRRNQQHFSHDPKESNRWFGFQLALVGFASCSFFLSQAYSAILYCLLAMIAARHIVVHETLQGGKSYENHARGRRSTELHEGRSTHKSYTKRRRR